MPGQISNLKHLLVALDCARLLSVDCLIELSRDKLQISSAGANYKYKAHIPLKSTLKRTALPLIFNAHSLARSLRIASNAEAVSFDIEGNMLHCLSYDHELKHTTSTSFSAIEPTLSDCINSLEVEFLSTNCITAIDTNTRDFVKVVRSLISVGSTITVKVYNAGIKFETNGGYASQERIFGSNIGEVIKCIKIETRELSAFARPAISQIGGRCTLRVYEGAVHVHCTDDSTSVLIHIRATKQDQGEGESHHV